MEESKALKLSKELMSKGYRRVSNKHNILARIDREDWQEHMAKEHAPWDIEEGRKWLQNLGENAAVDFYRRVLSKDKITVEPEVSKKVKSSC